MGICSSCCRRRKDPEREPLLPTDSSDDALPPPQSSFEKLADVLAAINAGKLPSQAQIDKALKSALASDALQPNVVLRGYGPLSESGRRVIEDARDLISAVLRAGVEKNADNKLQDLLYHLEHIDASSVNADVAITVKDDSVLPEVENAGTPKPLLSQTPHLTPSVQALPSSSELTEDTQSLVRSLRHLARLLLTSSAFRLILSDTLHTAREMLADAAAEVGGVALRAGVTAGKVERVVRPEGVDIDTMADVVGQLQEDVEAVRKVAGERGEALEREGPGRVREVVISRVQQTVVALHKSPQYREAFQTIVFILTKYATKVNTAATTVSTASNGLGDHMPVTLTPVVWADAHVSAALSDLRELLERLASGHALEPVFQLIHRTISHLGDPANEELNAFFGRAGGWLDRALDDVAYAVSDEGTYALEGLYDRAQELLREEGNAVWARDLRALMEEVQQFVEAIKGDRATRQLVGAVDGLADDLARVARDAATSGRQWSAEVQRDVLGWLLPRVLKGLLGVIPTPRVEYKSRSFDVVLDAGHVELGVGKAALPDKIVVQNYSEVRLEAVEVDEAAFNASAQGSGVQSFARVRVGVEGVRMHVRGLGYHVRYKAGWGMGYEDQGVVSVDVGSQAGDGLAVEVEVETASDSWLVASGLGKGDGEEEALFRVVDVRVVVPGLRFRLDESKHWVVNKVVVQPLAGPVVRTVVQRVVEDKVREVLEKVAGVLGNVRREVGERGEGVGVEEYWGAVLGLVGVGAEESEEGEEDEAHEAREDEPLVETRTEPTLKGIVRTTVTQRDASSLYPPTPEETVLAVGVGPQVLDDPAGPYGESGREEQREVRESVRAAVRTSREAVEEMEEGLERAGEDVGRAGERVEVRRRVEGRRAGWQSRVFDL
ncbi:hypothetical protein OE88DRAFT_1739005 [Heliocybe sulcata]|uniref:HAM1-like N-terminal domain-containing protein n=1 Tax=Heliocybe sulcata TaxID=5364 RepID=A0A5C3MNK8_9AGAM|nr:hypothetical protein OE88DRAFT_1739005 [Heliocybe sulcata]